jgi:hypothetical protein
MNKILGILYNTEQGYIPYVLKSALICLLPSLAISSIIDLVVPQSQGPEFSGSLLLNAIILVLLTPVIETLLMWPILRFLGRFISSSLYVALASASAWAVVHSLSAPVWGFIAFWPFFVLSIVFLEWEKKALSKAIGVTASIHMCQNFAGLLLMLFHNG